MQSEGARAPVRVGLPSLLEVVSGGAAHRQAAAAGERLEAAGRTAAVFLVDGIPAGVLALADQLRPDAGASVAALVALPGRTPVLLSGDNPAGGGPPGQRGRHHNVRAGLLPQDKVAPGESEAGGGGAVAAGRRRRQRCSRDCCRGLGAAIGRCGADLALESAEGVTVRVELANLPKITDVSGRAHRLVRPLSFASIALLVLVD